MTPTLFKIASALKPYMNGSIAMPDFIEAVSNIYHSHEAILYDAKHISLRDSELSWQNALDLIRPHLNYPIRLLDFGAGTGFGTLQVLNSNLGSSVKEVVCYDLSPVMMDICREKMRAFPTVSFVFLSDAIGRRELLNERPFDLVITNALLHHLLDVESFLAQVRQYVAPGGYYIAGHEPNFNYYVNAHLVKVTQKFQNYKRIRRRFSIKYWLHKAGIRKSFHDLVAVTNRTLIDRKLIKTAVPSKLLHKLIDIHVPFGISIDQPWGEIGFQGSQIKQWLGKEFEMEGKFTYSHIKDGLANSDPLWRKRLKTLRELYPNDGADGLFVFSRKF